MDFFLVEHGFDSLNLIIARVILVLYFKVKFMDQMKLLVLNMIRLNCIMFFYEKMGLAIEGGR